MHTQQRTLMRSTCLEGIGLHSGSHSKITLAPAPVDNGLVFTRVVNGQVEKCPAVIGNSRPMPLCTTIGSNGFQIQTVEHVLAALWNMEIDNAYLTIDSEEVPAMDGSAEPFVQAIRDAGIVEQNRSRAYAKIHKPIHVKDGQREISIFPSPFPKITYTIDYDQLLIQQQTYEYTWSPSDFCSNIAAARTFVLHDDIETILAKGLGKGGGLDNTLVFKENKVLNKNGLRFPDECVRHKVLDLIGDLALLNFPIIGHIQATQSGHDLHAQLIQKILDTPNAWTLIPGHPTPQPGIPEYCHIDRQPVISLSANPAP